MDLLPKQLAEAEGRQYSFLDDICLRNSESPHSKIPLSLKEREKVEGGRAGGWETRRDVFFLLES